MTGDTIRAAATLMRTRRDVGDPIVALAVADALDDAATYYDSADRYTPPPASSVALWADVARAYLDTTP